MNDEEAAMIWSEIEVEYNKTVDLLHRLLALADIKPLETYQRNIMGGIFVQFVPDSVES